MGKNSYLLISKSLNLCANLIVNAVCAIITAITKVCHTLAALPNKNIALSPRAMPLCSDTHAQIVIGHPVKPCTNTASLSVAATALSLNTLRLFSGSILSL